MLFGHQNLGIDTSYVEMRNIIFGNGRTFYPGLPYSENFDKDTPLQIFCKDVYLCFGTDKPNNE